MKSWLDWLARWRGPAPGSARSASASTGNGPTDRGVDLAAHVAGAIVGHDSPFSDLEVPRSDQPMHPRQLGIWCEPFYLMDLSRPEPAAVASLRALWSQIDDGIVRNLLGEFDWRPRLVAAYLIALKRLPGWDDSLGRLLLRSDVCFAGRGYCLALATSNSDVARDYLRRYLDYYLTRTDLRFDQDQAIAAIACLDQRNGTDLLSDYGSAWDAYVADKPSVTLARAIEQFKSNLDGLDALRAACS